MAALQNARQVTGRLRSQAARAVRDLAAIETAMGLEEALTDDTKFGTYRLRPHEPIDEDRLHSFLRSARREHPDQELVIAVVARDHEPPTS